MKQTIRIDGKKHSMLRCFESLYHSLCCIDGVHNAGIGRYFIKKREEPGLCIQYIDATKRVIKIKATRGAKKQYFFLRAKPGELETAKKSLINILN